jgi:FkbM family methyltransferase
MLHLGDRSEGILCHGLLVPASDAEIFARYGEFDGLPDLDVSKVAKCAAMCQTFGTALDVGAHVGAVAAYLARKFAFVVAFEAIPTTFDFLHSNTAGLSNVSALNIAVGPKNGEVYLSHYAHHGQLSHVVGTTDSAKVERIGPIPERTIDSMEISDVSFVKIDVEGYELQVLEGALQTLKQCRPLVLVEQGGNEEKHFGRPRNEASRFLESLGMRLHPDAPRMKKDRLYVF